MRACHACGEPANGVHVPSCGSGLTAPLPGPAEDLGTAWGWFMSCG